MVKVVIALALAGAAILIAAPWPLVPWGGWTHGLGWSWWVLPSAVSLTLLIAGALLPERQAVYPDHRSEAIAGAIGLALLLLLEPLLHLSIVAMAWVIPTIAGDVLFPPSASGANLALRVAVLAVLAPVGEEVFFRGRLQPLLAQRFGPGGAIVVTALIFALAHGDLLRASVALPLGLLLGCLRHATGSLKACILVHQVHNGLLVLAGPGLAIAPLVGLILALAGSLLFLVAAVAAPGFSLRRLALAVLGVAAIGAALPLVRAGQDRMWATAAAALMREGRSEDLDRLTRLRAQGRLTAERASVLAGTLGPDEIAAALAWPAGLRGSLPLAEALAERGDEPFAVDAGRRLLELSPDLAGELAVTQPEALACWLPLPAQRERVRTVLRSIDGPPRRRVLGAMELAWPGEMAAVIESMPEDERRPMDERHLRLHQR